SDKPDLRFDLPIKDITKVFANTNIEFMKNVLVNAIVVNDKASEFSRKEIDKLTEFVKTYKASGLAYLKMDKELTGSIAKLLNDEERTNLIKELNLKDNDIVFIVSGKKNIVKSSLGALRIKLGHDLNLIQDGDYKLLWVVDFPSFEWSEEEGRFMAMHHPFTAPKDEDIDKLINDKEHCYSKAYDIVI